MRPSRTGRHAASATTTAPVFPTTTTRNSVRRRAAGNIAKAWLLVIALAAPLGALGYALGETATASLFVFCALLAAAAVYAYGDRALLAMLGAREYALAEDPLLRSTVDRLAAKAAVRPPKLYLIADGFPRAFVAGRGPRSSSLAVSTGLLGALSAGELEAVLAHELAHVWRFDALTQLVAQVACAVYWFHPLVWLAARRVRIEAERACDALVVRAGMLPPDYAGDLLEIARTMRSSSTAAGSSSPAIGRAPARATRCGTAARSSTGPSSARCRSRSASTRAVLPRPTSEGCCESSSPLPSVLPRRRS